MIIYQLTEPENRVWAFDQSTANLGAGQGFCAGMVIVWIFLRARDRDFDTTMGDIGGLRFPTIDFEAEELRKVQAYQAACAEKPGKRGYRSVLNPEQYEVEKAILAGPDVDADHRSLASTVSRMARQSPTLTEGTGRIRTWFLLRMRPARTKAEGGSGHVVAIEAERQNGNKVFRLMDPSNGQCQFIGTGDFRNWLTNVFSGGPVTRSSIRTSRSTRSRAWSRPARARSPRNSRRSSSAIEYSSREMLIKCDPGI